uniref:Uncharacterized protein n=1 Tax=Nelumbo nucifera TaxID=4432 RepID=A0A822Y0F3_NELNU|nr:TPA_asm: hypothetical protein HUJ06_028862 [Nelumbo nucifera]
MASFLYYTAPGDDYLSILIRTLGDWTSQLKAVFAQVVETVDRWPLWSPGTGLQRIWCPAPCWAGDRRHTTDQYS